MKYQSTPHVKQSEKANPLMKAAFLAALVLALLPAAIYGAIHCVQSRTEAAAKNIEVKEATTKRSTVAERRAQRREARKAKEAQEQAFYPEISMETVEQPYYDGFGMEPGADMNYNGFGMMPPSPMGVPGMMPPPYMGGYGMMPAPFRGNNGDGFGRMPY